MEARSRLMGEGIAQHIWQRLVERRSAPLQPPKVQAALEIPRYPPFPEGLPATPIDAVLSSQSELIEHIRGTLGYTPGEFEHWVAPILYRYAAFVHLLPASAHHHHRGAGGLWRHSLEVAFGAAQGSEGLLFALSASPDQRREGESRWRLAACLAGLLHDAGKPFSDVTVSDPAGCQVWSPYLESLADWIQRHQIERYFVQWPHRLHKRHETFALLSIPRILTQETADYLAAFGPEPLARLLETLTAQTPDQPLARLVQQADQTSVSLDLKQNGLGTAVEQYVLALIRRLLHSGRWSVNTADAQVWHLRQGAFLDWERGFSDLLAIIRQDQVPGVPQDAERMADTLIERGIAQPFPLQQAAKGRYWPIRLPASLRLKTSAVCWMLRLTIPEWIFVADIPAPLDGAVILEAGEGTTGERDAGRDEYGQAAQIEAEPSHSAGPPALHSASAASPNQPTFKTISTNKTVSTHPQSVRRPNDGGREALSKTLEQYGAASRWLHAALDPMLENLQAFGEVIDVLEDRIVMLHPEGTRRIGPPVEVMTALFEAGAIESDLTYPDRKVRTMQGKKVLVFAETLSNAVLTALKATEQRRAPLPPSVEHPSIADSPASVETSALETAAKPAAPSHDLSEDSRAFKPSKCQAESSRPDDALSNLENPSVCLLPAANNPSPVQESPQVRIEQALGQLAEMIRTGKGRWLVTPVVHQNGESSTSARCLDRLASEHPGISLVHLRLALRNLDTPRFALDGDQLILKALPDVEAL